MKLLHIVATPRERKSNTLQVADAFLETLRARYPAMQVDVLDLFQSDMPAAAGDNIDTKYTLMAGQPIDREHQQSWQQIEILIERFLSADIYLISAPMWNFSIPYALKYYIDCIFQPGYLFRYNELGQAIGLVQDKKMVCVTTRGGDYSPQSPFHVYDFQEPYLRAIFGFAGIRDLQFISAQPMDVTLALRESALADAIAQARSLASNTAWAVVPHIDGQTNPPELKPVRR